MKLLTNFFLVVVFMACSENTTVSKDILTKEEMAKVLADVQLIESALKVKSDNKELSSDSLNLYESLFEEYHINREVFQENINYYSAHPELMEEVYDEVLIILSDKLAEFEAEKPND